MIVGNKKTYLGRGWAFPPAFEKNDRTQKVRLDMVEAETDIRESIFILLSTLPGERLMNQEFGCDLHSQVFGIIDGNTLAKIEGLVADAILYFEPRVELDYVEVNDDQAVDGYLSIEIHYTIQSSNTRSNMVYPFYLKEGTILTEM